MKYIPNTLTFLRIAAAAVLFFVPPLSVIYIVFYFICGASDVLDGLCARALHAQSSFGSKLDTLADAAVILAALITLRDLIPYNSLLVTWVIIIAVLKVRAFFKNKRFDSPHTTADKAVGALLFLYPFTLLFTQNIWIAYSVCMAATYAVSGELRRE
ncbi:MAG: CDP-alcohol phosphatidyltransferase family protein [Clostridia bacterium]|nr:CDP-alcohol phosphatidyltransferase family protein [Clostridia bacterium]